MSRISRKVREEAIKECLLRSDYWAHFGDNDEPTGPIYESSLADDAVEAVRDADETIFDNVFSYLEAAALLRGDDEHEPWSPGDPVYLLGAP